MSASGEKISAGFPYASFPPLRFTWCNHDFVFLGADPQEREVVLRIDVSHGAPCLHDEAVHEARVLDRRGVVHSAFDRDTCSRWDSKGQ